MDSINDKYVGFDTNEVVSSLESQGFKVKLIHILGNKDNDVLKDDVVVRLKLLSNDEVEVISTKFKKYPNENDLKEFKNR